MSLPLPGQGCPISSVVDLVFSRWTTPILWALQSYGQLRFLELQRAIGTVTPKVLTQRLRQLERDGLVARSFTAGVPPTSAYEITVLGASLAPVFAALVQWSDEHLELVRAAQLDYDVVNRPLSPQAVLARSRG